MSQEQQQKNTATDTVVGLLIAALFYTALGLVAGILYAFGAPFAGLATVGLGPFLAFWWAYLLALIPPISLFVTVWRATDPMTQALKKLTGTNPGAEHQ
jgi:hypothetical protein